MDMVTIMERTKSASLEDGPYVLEKGKLSEAAEESEREYRRFVDSVNRAKDTEMEAAYLRV